MAEKKSEIKRKIIFTVGFLLCLCPLISSMIQWQYQKEAVATYNNVVKVTDDEDLEEYLEQAVQYNKALYEYEKGISTGNGSNEILTSDSYYSLLNLSDTGAMGSIDIPKINVSLPIYHGTGDDVLASGVGHVELTSLPVGGENTRSVLTGHRGSPSSKLFTRLDEMVEGDMFYIRVMNKTLAYQVTEIEVIDPDDVEKVNIVEGKDLVTLLTCTPYGINTHRLLVTGERVPYVKEVEEAIESETMSIREIVITILPFVFALAAIILYAMRKRKNKHISKGRETFNEIKKD